MKTRLQKKKSKEKKIIYFIISLFVLNAFGTIPIMVIGAYTAEPMMITTRETLEDGTIYEQTHKKYYHEKLSENLSTYVYEFFRYALPIDLIGYSIVTLPDFSFDYAAVTVWILSLVSIPLVLKHTAGFPMWRRLVYVYLIAVILSGMWGLSGVELDCIDFIDYPIRPGGLPCGARYL